MTDFRFPTNPSELEQHYTVLKKRFVNDRLLSEDDFGLLIELLNGSCRGVLDLHADFGASSHAIADSLEVLTATQQAHASELAQLPPQLAALSGRVSALEDSLNRTLQRFDDAQAATQQRSDTLQSALDGHGSNLSQLRTLLAQQDAQLLAQAQRLQQLEGRLPPIVPEAVENHAAPPALTAPPAEIIPPPPDGSEAAVTGTESATASTADTASEDATTSAIVTDTASAAANVDADGSHPASTAQTDPAPASTASEDATTSAIVADTASTAANVDDHTDASTESASPAVTDSTAASPASAASPLRRLIDTLATLRGGGNG